MCHPHLILGDHSRQAESRIDEWALPYDLGMPSVLPSPNTMPPTNGSRMTARGDSTPSSSAVEPGYPTETSRTVDLQALNSKFTKFMAGCCRLPEPVPVDQSILQIDIDKFLDTDCLSSASIHKLEESSEFLPQDDLHDFTELLDLHYLQEI